MCLKSIIHFIYEIYGKLKLSYLIRYTNIFTGKIFCFHEIMIIFFSFQLSPEFFVLIEKKWLKRPMFQLHTKTISIHNDITCSKCPIVFVSFSSFYLSFL